MKKYWIKLLVLLFPVTLGADISFCSLHQTYCKVVKNQPDIDRSYASRVATAIDKYSFIYGIDANLLIAIYAQESKYKLNMVNKRTLDYGISQINHNTARKFHLNKNKLLTDIDYSVEAGAIILADFKKRFSKREQDWWSRYNTSNPKLRKKYKNKVLRYM